MCHTNNLHSKIDSSKTHWATLFGLFWKLCECGDTSNPAIQAEYLRWTQGIYRAMWQVVSSLTPALVVINCALTLSIHQSSGKSMVLSHY